MAFRFLLRLCAAFALLAIWFLPQEAFADPRQWGGSWGRPIRQGLHIEWQRNNYRRADGSTLVVWSDTRFASRDIFAQLISPTGQQMWDSTGQRIIVYPARQEDPDVVAVQGGWFIAWVDFRFDTAGDVYAQKIDDGGHRLWDSLGVMVDTSSAIVNQYSIRVADDGQGGGMVAWENARAGDPGDIYAMHLNAQGQRAWPRAVAVTDTFGGQTDITAESDGFGNMLLAWNDLRDQSNPDIFAAKIVPAANPAQALPWGRNGVTVCTAAGRQLGVKLALDGFGGCYLTWLDYRSGDQSDIYAQRMSANGQAQWTQDGVAVCTAVGDQTGPRAATSFNDTTRDGCILTWEDTRVNGGTIETYAQKLSTSGGALWTTDGIKVCGDASPDPHNLGNTRQGGRLTSDRLGGLICAWEDTRADGDWNRCDLYAARVLANGTLGWTGPCGVLVADGKNQQFAPLLRPDASGNVLIVYDDTRMGSQSIRYQKINIATGARLLNPEGVQILYGLDGDTQYPRSVSLGGGRVAMVWADGRMGVDGTALFYQIVDTVGHIERTLNGDTLTPDNESRTFNQQSHQICADGFGGFFVSFEDLRNGPRQVRMAHIAADGRLVSSTAGERVYPQDNDEKEIFIAADGAHGCYVGWSELLPPDYYFDIFVDRVDAACHPVWAQPARITPGGTDHHLWSVVSNPDGSCIAVWTYGQSASADIGIARIMADGSIAWNDTLCNAAFIQNKPDMIADGAGGAFVAWEDSRLQSRFLDVYAQHVNANGQILWDSTGLRVVSDTLNQNNVQITLDHRGNLIVAWEDFRSGSATDIYAQKIAPNGHFFWPSSGLPVCVGLVSHTGIALHSDPAGGVYMAWSDERDRTTAINIFGTHLDSTGNPADGGAYWTAGSGGSICSEIMIQQKATLADDGHGGAICTWEDQRASGKQPLLEVWANWINDYTVGVRRLPEAVLPTRPELSQNYPNPFNPTTMITFSLVRNERAELEIFNDLGQKVTTLVDQMLVAGKYQVRYDASRLASGVYFYRLKTPSYMNVKKMLLLK
jgi:hypothetical protein